MFADIEHERLGQQQREETGDSESNRYERFFDLQQFEVATEENSDDADNDTESV